MRVGFFRAWHLSFRSEQPRRPRRWERKRGVSHVSFVRWNLLNILTGGKDSFEGNRAAIAEPAGRAFHAYTFVREAKVRGTFHANQFCEMALTQYGAKFAERRHRWRFLEPVRKRLRARTLKQNDLCLRKWRNMCKTLSSGAPRRSWIW